MAEEWRDLRLSLSRRVSDALTRSASHRPASSYPGVLTTMQVIRDAQPDEVRWRRLRRALWITILGNVALALGKGIIAYLSDSVALYADAANSVSDVAYSLLMVLGLWMSQRPPDLSHPQGHSRFEPLAGLVVASAMTLAGFEAGRAGVVRLLEGGAAVDIGWPTIALLVSAGVKATMYVSISRIARLTASPTLGAAAKDNLADVLTSSAAFLGTLGSRYIHPLADPIAGILVAIWIFKSALSVWGENLKYLSGGGAPSDMRAEIAGAAASVGGVLSVHQVITEHVGPNFIADLHINVDGALPLFDAHAISDEVRRRVEALDGIDRAYIHLEPCETVDPQAAAMNVPQGRHES
jgi:cation diffusion facilitator family transporter